MWNGSILEPEQSASAYRGSANKLIKRPVSFVRERAKQKGLGEKERAIMKRLRVDSHSRRKGVDWMQTVQGNNNHCWCRNQRRRDIWIKEKDCRDIIKPGLLKIYLPNVGVALLKLLLTKVKVVNKKNTVTAFALKTFWLLLVFSIRKEFWSRQNSCQRRFGSMCLGSCDMQAVVPFKKNVCRN